MAKVVVIGGGTAGLAAAYTLEKAGVECVVLEKREFSGGRLYGIQKEGFTLDLGAQFFFSRYRTTFELMRSLGIHDQLVKWQKPMGILRDGTVHPAYPKVTDAIRHLPSQLKFGAISTRGKRQALFMVMRLIAVSKKLDFDDPLKAIELDNISFADYARRHWGEEILEYAIQPVASTLTLGEPEDISAAYGLALMWYFLPGLSTTTKGIGYLAETLASKVKDIRLDTAASRVVLEKNKVKGVVVEGGKKGDVLKADGVVCATLAPEAAALLGDGVSAPISDTLAGLKYSACTHVLFATRGRLLGDMYAVATPRREGLCMSGFTDSANKAGTYAPPNTSLINVFTFGDFAREMLEWDDEKVRERAIHDLQSVVPQFPDEPMFTEIFRWPQAVCLSGPGQITSVQKLKVGLREYKGLELAGEYFGMPSVEAALNSGVKAADRLLKTL